MKRLFTIVGLLLGLSYPLHAGRSGITSVVTEGTVPAGSNGSVQINSGGRLGASSNLTFSTTTNQLSVSSISVTYVDVSTVNLKQIRFPDGTTQSTAGGAGGSNTQVQFNNSGSLGGSSAFTWNGTTLTASAVSASTGAFTQLSVSGADTTFSSSQLNLTDGYGPKWGTNAFYGNDASNYFRWDVDGSERMRYNSTGLAISRGSAIPSTQIDAPVDIWIDGITSRFVNIASTGSNYTEVPLILLENYQPVSQVNGNGTAIGFYGTDSAGAQYQQGIIGFSANGASTTTSKMQIYLNSASQSVPVIKMLGSGTSGYAYTLFGGPQDFTPGSPVHVAGNSGDVDRGLRIQTGPSSRFNITGNSSQNLMIRDVDTVGSETVFEKGTGKVSMAGTLTASKGILTSTMTIGNTASSLAMLEISKDESGAGFIAFINEGVQRGYINFASDESLTLGTQTGVPVTIVTNNSAQFRFGSDGSLSLWAAAISNQQPGRFTVGGTNASFVVDASTATGANTVSLGTTSPAAAGGPMWISAKVCNNVGTGCTNGYIPFWPQ